jgi:3-oxoacyl-[acyl-carrier-protein] synthase III
MRSPVVSNQVQQRLGHGSRVARRDAQMACAAEILALYEQDELWARKKKAEIALDGVPHRSPE